MRPLHRPPWQPQWDGLPTAEVAVGALGAYCATCERPLPQECYAWDAARWRPAPSSAAEGQWRDALPLCRHCTEAAAASAPAGVLLPDRDRTFSLGAASPIRYELRSLTVFRGPDSEGPAPVGSEERAVAVPGADEGATIAAFALNTAGHDGGDRIVLGAEHPDLDAADFDDPRLRLRTEAWHAATSLARAIAGASDPEARRLAEAYALMTVEQTGFWSVWATVLWESLGETTTLRRILLPAAPGPGLPGDPAVSAPSAFPATRDDALAAPGDDREEP